MKYIFRGKRLEGEPTWVFGSLIEGPDDMMWIQDLQKGNEPTGYLGPIAVDPKTVGLFMIHRS